MNSAMFALGFMVGGVVAVFVTHKIHMSVIHLQKGFLEGWHKRAVEARQEAADWKEKYERLLSEGGDGKKDNADWWKDN